VAPNDSGLSKKDRQEAARAKAFELKKQQQQREARARLITLVSVVVGLALVVVLVVVIVKQGTKDAAVTSAGPVTATATNGGIPFGKGGTAGTSNEDAVDVAVYVDFMCPACGQFESTNTANLDEMREAGDITLTMHPIAILDRLSQGTQYSTRAASAFSYVADKDPEHALAFSKQLFANQPEENSTGNTDEQLVGFAKAAGVPDDIAEASVKGAFTDWVTQSTDVATATESLQTSGQFSTPTIVLNGTKYDGNWSDADTFKSDVEALKKS